MTYSDYKEETSKTKNDIFTKYNVFWAFGNEQFKKAYAELNLAEGEKVASIGSGGYIPSKNVDNWLEELKEIPKFTGDKVAGIKYELNNHEYKYCLDPKDCIDTVFSIMDSCTDGITLDLVKSVARYEDK